MEPADKYGQTHQPRDGIKRKGSWMKEEDDLLRKCIEKYGEGSWNKVPLLAGLNRCRKSCRLRWLNYLQPNIKQGEFAMDEVDLMIRMHKLFGNKWSLIAGRLPGRTANGVKNYWNTHLKQSKQRTENNVTININKVDDKQIIRNDHQGKVPVIRPQPQSFSENSKWMKRILMHRGTDNEQPTSSSSSHMVTKSTYSHEPLPEFLTDDALPSWWQENIDVFIEHDDHRMMKRKREVLLAENKVINSACCCRCHCNKSTTDDQSTMSTDKEQQDLCVDDYLLNELQNIQW